MQYALGLAGQLIPGAAVSCSSGSTHCLKWLANWRDPIDERTGVPTIRHTHQPDANMPDVCFKNLLAVLGFGGAFQSPFLGLAQASRGRCHCCQRRSAKHAKTLLLAAKERNQRVQLRDRGCKNVRLSLCFTPRRACTSLQRRKRHLVLSLLPPCPRRHPKLFFGSKRHSHAKSRGSIMMVPRSQNPGFSKICRDPSFALAFVSLGQHSVF
jgi:hypothetical protein